MICKAKAVVRLKFPSEKEISIAQIALKPETEVSSTSRSRVRIEREGRSLTLIFESKDSTALRAAVNSYLSWLSLIEGIYVVLESL